MPERWVVSAMNSSHLSSRELDQGAAPSVMRAMNFPTCHREKRSDVAIHLTGLPHSAARARNNSEFIRSAATPGGGGIQPFDGQVAPCSQATRGKELGAAQPYYRAT